ncbi:hypothetical protein EMIT0P395_150170 [Pseudomonas sp. IT-P395]
MKAMYQCCLKGGFKAKVKSLSS